MTMEIRGDGEEEVSGGFQFEAQDGFKTCLETSPEFKALIQKWGMDSCMSVKKFTFDEFFSAHQKDVFFQDFFASPEVQKHMQVVSGRGTWAPVAPVRSVQAEEIKATVTNMEFFQKIYELEPPVVRENGGICKCFDEIVDGVVLSDELRKLLVMEDSEHFYEFSAEERKEFLLHILKRVAVGGGTCQYEDEIKPYLDVAKLFYKDMVSVSKNASTKKLEVRSVVYEIESVDADFTLFPEGANESYSFCYAVIEPLQRHVTIWYMAHLPLF